MVNTSASCGPHAKVYPLALWILGKSLHDVRFRVFDFMGDLRSGNSLHGY